MRLGQNFLADPNLLDSIVRDSGVRPDDVVLEGARYRVVRVGRSPLPGDPRRCAYVEPSGSGPA